MEYKLGHIDKLVTIIINGIRENGIVLSEDDYKNILHETLEEKDRICAFIVEQIFRFTKEKEIELFIYNYQSALTSLLDKLYRHQQQIESPASSILHFYDSIYQNILTILTFIEERFSKYFDKEEKVPDVYLLLIRQEMKNKLSSVKEIESFSEHDHISFHKILHALHAFAENKTTGIVTYKDVMYRKELIKELNEISSWSTETSVYTGLNQLLIYLNYNDKEYINDMVNLFAHEINEFEDFNDKIDKILIYSKTINQLQIKPDCGLHPKHPSVKTQFSNWFSEELYYLEKKLGLMNVPNHTAETKPPETKANVVCHLSVDQIAIFFRAATDIKIISTSSQRVLFEKITPFISTPYKKNISADSMRSKSYSPEGKDIETMKDILMQLYKKLTQY